MKHIYTSLLLVLLINLDSIAQKIDSYNQKFGELVITLPSKPEILDMEDNVMLKLDTPKGQFIAVKIDMTKHKSELPSKDTIRKFYKKVISDRFSEWNIKSNEIIFFKIGEHDAAFLPVRDQFIGNGYCILVLINNEYYTVMYTVRADNKELEYSKDKFIDLIKLNL